MATTMVVEIMEVDVVRSQRILFFSQLLHYHFLRYLILIHHHIDHFEAKTNSKTYPMKFAIHFFSLKGKSESNLNAYI